jgi:hypothetical protein
MELTIENLSSAKFRGPVAFYDGRGGMARQDFECVDEPRFGYFWRRETRKDKGRQAYMVDGKEVTDLAEACKLLAHPPASDSPAETMRRSMEEFHASPKLNYGATRALSEARCNADAGPFGMVRAWMHRAENAWHRGMNAFSDSERKAGREFPSWVYDGKNAAHESSRAMYLFAADREKDTGLKCSLGITCRECPIFNQIEKSMTEARTQGPFAQAIEDSDIDAAKFWTCMSHILTTQDHRVIDGTFLSTKDDRSNPY